MKTLGKVQGVDVSDDGASAHINLKLHECAWPPFECSTRHRHRQLPLQAGHDAYRWAQVSDPKPCSGVQVQPLATDAERDPVNRKLGWIQARASKVGIRTSFRKRSLEGTDGCLKTAALPETCSR